MKARILWVEGKRADSPSFVPTLRKKDYFVETVPTGNAALTRTSEFNPDLIVVNAASLRSNGKRICRSIRERMNSIPIILITDPDEYISKEETLATVILSLPFTARKLINRIAPFIPGAGQETLHAGHLRLDLERKRVRCQGKESRLTPRLTRILQILMDHAGEVVERDQLFREAWRTEYTGDTRTLDVHISWLRQAIEEDPRHPRYLKTIRRLGYRLDAE
jgi:DNA-binding response OmpR family regulator